MLLRQTCTKLALAQERDTCAPGVWPLESRNGVGWWRHPHGCDPSGFTKTGRGEILETANGGQRKSTSPNEIGRGESGIRAGHFSAVSYCVRRRYGWEAGIRTPIPWSRGPENLVGDFGFCRICSATYELASCRFRWRWDFRWRKFQVSFKSCSFDSQDGPSPPRTIDFCANSRAAFVGEFSCICWRTN